MKEIQLTYNRRKTTTTHVGALCIGSDYPIRVQSMANTNTNDIEGSVAQAQRIIAAGGELVRFTTQGLKEVESLKTIHSQLSTVNCQLSTPLVADVHFNAAVADEAAKVVEKVRINPGNYIDPARKFVQLEYTDEEYKQELMRLRERFTQLLNICKEHHTALRLGVNHGSLSDRIMSHYGDTPAGMVESLMEFLRVARDEQFNDIVLSVKASNTQIMVETVRLLVKTMDAENMHYPLHLGVTEAGAGEDGRLKSAVGIGALLADGIGDTIRVSLTEAPEAEIPVAQALVDYFTNPDSPRYTQVCIAIPEPRNATPETRHPTRDTRLAVRYESLEASPFFPLHAAADLGKVLFDLRAQGEAVFNRLQGEASSRRLEAPTGSEIDLQIINPNVPADQLRQLEKDILQAARIKLYKTEYIACPSCGRTLFDLEKTLAEVKAATEHLKGLKIAVMGCIVNGPGEMADADYGYVGAGRGRVSLYRKKECILKNIPQEDAVAELLKLIKNQ